ncbi:MAG: hypothetical protein TEF_00625 [Rhizobiales bacterium NRL2]|jgi:hypothetical protein|nr:MAG: hypothetical protein TEF_00625 [Rhizobiales bacterium NRL2]
MQTDKRQRHGLSRLIPLAAAGFASVAVVAAAEAQPIRENFNFRGGNQAVSFAHRQAILDQQLRGVTPDNLLRGSDGRLLEVERGPDGVAIVREQVGAAIPTGSVVLSSRGADGFSFGVGGFNAHFGSGGASGAFVVTPPVGGETGDTVNNWVSLVSPGAGAAGGRGAIDTWTRQAASMGASGASPQPR